MMEARVQEALFYITAGLCTFLAIVLSYRWMAGHLKKKKDEEEAKEKKGAEKGGEGDAKDEVKDGDGEMKKVEKVEEMEKAEDEEEEEEEESNMAAGCPFSFLMSQMADSPAGPIPVRSKDSLDDLLIDGSEIQPLTEEEKEGLEEECLGAKESLERRRVKELEEEVVRSMTEQQLHEEARARQAQLEAIFNLMQDNKERFGMSSVDDVQNQYKLYV